MEYTVYPLGYIGSKHEGHQDGTPCPLILDLWNTHSGELHKLDLQTHHLNVLNYAIDQFRAMGGINGFVRANIEHAKLTRSEVKFLLDTLRFIKTGKREIGMMSWDMMLSFKDRESPLYRVDESYESFLLSDEEDDEALSRWISHYNGFNDLIHTLRILFGNVDQYQDPITTPGY